MPITALPDAPSRAQPSQFANKGDALLGALGNFVTQANALESNVNAKEASAVSAASTATTKAAEAAASAAEAASTTNVTKWISGTNYSAGVCTWSPTDYKTYRRKSPGGVSTTDPSGDSSGWALVAAAIGITTTNTQTLSLDLVLTSSSARMQILSATGYGYKVKFPAANTLTIAEPALSFVNDGNYPIGLTDGTDQLLGQILPGDKVNFALINNASVAGTWRADGNLDPWFITAEVGATVYTGGNQIKISETASWLYYQNSSSYPCVRYVSHPADGSLAVGNEYVLDTAPVTVLPNDSFPLGSTRYVFAINNGKYVCVDFASAPTLSVGAAVVHGLGGTWAQAFTKGLDSQYFMAFSTNQASSRWEAACYDCGASGTTIAAGSPAFLTGLGSSGQTLLKTHLVDATHVGVYGRHSGGTSFSQAAAVVTRTSGTTVSWSANAGTPTSARNSDANFYDSAHFVAGNVYLVPYYTNSTPPNYATLTFSTSGASWGAPATSTLPLSGIGINVTQIGASAFLVGGSMSTPKLDLVTISGTSCTSTLSPLIDNAGTSGTVSVVAASALDGKGVVQYTANSKAGKYAAFAVSGSTINFGSTKWEHYTSSSNSNVLNASSFGFNVYSGAAAAYRLVIASNASSSTDQGSSIATLSIDASGNPTLSPFFGDVEQVVLQGFAITGASDRVALSGTSSSGAFYRNGVFNGSKFKWGRGSFRRPTPQTGSTIAGGGHMLGILQTDHRFGRNLTINRYRFAEAYA